MNNDYKLFYAKLLYKISEASKATSVKDIHLSIQQKALTPKKYKSVVSIHPLYKGKKAHTPIVAISTDVFKNERLMKITKEIKSSSHQNRTTTPDMTNRRKMAHCRVKTMTEYHKAINKRLHRFHKFTPQISQIQGIKISIHAGRPYHTVSSQTQTPRASKTQHITIR